MDCLVRLCLVLQGATKLSPKGAAQSALPPAAWEGPCGSTAFGAVSALDLGHSHKCVLVSRCRFNLLSPGDTRYGASVWLIYYLCVFFGGVSVKISGPF